MLPGTREKISKRHTHTTHICNKHPNTVFLMTTIPPTPTRSRHHNIRQRSSLFLGKPWSQFSPFYEGKIILEKDPSNESLEFLPQIHISWTGQESKSWDMFQHKKSGIVSLINSSQTMCHLLYFLIQRLTFVSTSRLVTPNISDCSDQQNDHISRNGMSLKLHFPSALWMPEHPSHIY